jgi:hypothetical protein
VLRNVTIPLIIAAILAREGEHDHDRSQARSGQLLSCARFGAAADVLTSLPMPVGTRPDYWTERAAECQRLADSILARVAPRIGWLPAELVGL